MNSILITAALILALLAGIQAIRITLSIHKKYRLPYLNTYLYYQIFINIFGIYGLLGMVIGKSLLEQQEFPARTVVTISQFFLFLGVPFLIFAWYMFLRLSREIIDRKLPRVFEVVYFFLISTAFAAYFASLFTFSNFSKTQPAAFSSIVRYVLVSFEGLVALGALLPLLFETAELTDIRKKKATRLFAVVYLGIFSVNIFLFLYAEKNLLLTSLYIVVFFAGNIPPLLIWKSFLKKHFIPPVFQAEGGLTLRQFVDKFKISQREEEVIRQICAGKSNKEISMALFISLQTVKDHVYKIYLKTDVKNRVQLINLIQSVDRDQSG